MVALTHEAQSYDIQLLIENIFQGWSIQSPCADTRRSTMWSISSRSNNGDIEYTMAARQPVGYKSYFRPRLHFENEAHQRRWAMLVHCKGISSWLVTWTRDWNEATKQLIKRGEPCGPLWTLHHSFLYAGDAVPHALQRDFGCGVRLLAYTHISLCVLDTQSC